MKTRFKNMTMWFIALAGLIMTTNAAQAQYYHVEHNGLYYIITGCEGLSCDVAVVPEKEDYPYYEDANKPKGDVKIPSTFSSSPSYTVTEIGDKAFWGCKALTSVTIPEGVTTIGKNAFFNCLALTSVSIPNSVTEIKEYAFNECKALTSVSIPQGVKTIKKYTFRYCYALKSVDIPNSVTEIGEGAFYTCKALTSSIIPNSVKTIGKTAFYDCYALKSVDIPNSVKTIDKWAFGGCFALKTVTVHWDTPLTIDAGVFKDVNISKVTLKVPKGTAAAYKAAPVWKEFKIDDGTPPTKPVTSVTLDQHTLNLNMVKTYKMNATVLPTDATNKTLTWTSSAPSVATVDGTGLVTILAKGTTVITATANDGSSESDQCTVIVHSVVANETLEGIKVWTADGRLFLTLPAPQTVRIYNVSGALVKELALPAGDTSHPLPTGFYIVQLGTQVKKVIVK